MKNIERSLLNSSNSPFDPYFWAVLAVLVLLLAFSSGCAVQIPNTRVCAVAGMFQAGADCAWTLEDKTEALDIEEFVEFLEPTPERGPAMCVSAEDYSKTKTALEQLCKKIGSGCTREIKEKMAEISGRVDRLQMRTLARPVDEMNAKRATGIDDTSEGIDRE